MAKGAPSPPNPSQVAAGQTASNISTAIGQQRLNAINQVGPQGSLTYSQTGTYKYTDPESGKTYELPQLTQTTSLSPEQQAIFQTGQRTQQNLANVAQEQSGRLSGLLAQPFSLSNEATEARLMELGRSRLDPLLAQRRQSAETDLVNRGIRPGSTAYDRAIGNVNQAETDAYNQLLLQGRGQAVQEALMQRTQPLNELLALSGQGQIQTPQFASTPQTGLAGTDVAGITQAGYANQLGAYNQNQQMLGGLFSAGANLLPLMLSDRRAKRNIKRVGTLDNGLGVYLYTYVHGGPPQIGVMADEVEGVHPEAVVMGPDGYKRVDYERAVA